ncbi:MAG TPA: DUF1826 domain-containing protein [Nitrosomonas sp.]|nr:DUF1826 domain-containing protein [Nitrosomonas sp.]
MEIVSAKTGHSMSQLRPESSVCISGNAPEILTRIYDTYIKLCIYKRAISTNVKEYVIFLQNSFHDFQLTQIVSLHELNGLLCASLPQHQYRQDFLEDVFTVTEMYACLFGLGQVGFRLCVLNKTMCPRFHTDKVLCRLVTTYQGVATEWLPYQVVNREKLSAGSDGQPDRQSGLFNNQHDIQQLSCGDVALLKGELWEGNENAGLVHRSPAMLAGESRLLLTLDFSN